MKRFLSALLLSAIALVGSFHSDAGLINVSGSPGLLPSSGSLNIGTLSLDGFATPEQVALVLPVTGSLTTNATAGCEYKRTVDSSYSTCPPLHRVRPSYISPNSPYTVDDVFAWPVIDLAQGTSYDFRVTVSDGTTTVQKTLTTSTRALPVASGSTTVSISAGSSAATIQSQINGAAAGAVVELADGTYSLSAALNVTNTNGTNGSPIYVRGASRANTILSHTTGSVFTIAAGVKNIIFERMTLTGSGVDSGTASSSTAVSFTAGGTAQDRLTFRNMAFTGFDRGIGGKGEVDEILVYNNTLTGNNSWTQDFYSQNGTGAPGAGDGTPDLQQNVFWNDDGIALTGQGNAAFNNTLTGFGDALTLSWGTGDSTANDVTALNKGVFYYRNDVPMTGDDGFELDYGFRNIAVYDNRLRNTATLVSLDPIFGGPVLIARNISINAARSPYKYNSSGTGHYTYNNTVIRTNGFGSGASWGWNQSGDGGANQHRAWGYRNNLLIYRGTGHLMAMEVVTCNPILFDHNGWYSAGDTQVWWTNCGGSYATPAAAFSALSSTISPLAGAVTTHRHESDQLTTSTPFNETVTLGADWSTLAAAVTPTVANGATVRNAGVALPGITDGFTGAAPDMGATFSRSGSLPTYGDQSSGGSAIGYVSSLTAYQVLALNTTTGGFSTPTSVTPSGGAQGNWISGDPAAGAFSRWLSTWGGGGKGTSGTKLVAHQGGHNDSANNGVYIYDFAGSSAPAGFASPLVISAVSSVQDAEVYSDGFPTSVHPYDGEAVLNGVLYRFLGSRYAGGQSAGRNWKFDLSAGTWTQLAGNGGIDPYFTNRTLTIPDETTGKILVINQGYNVGWFYRTGANTWSGGSDMGFSPGDYPIGIRGPGNEGLIIGSGSGGGRLVTANFTSDTASSTSVTFSGSTTILASGGLSGVYDPTTDHYWVWGGDSSAGYTTIYDIKRGTWVVTAHALTGDSISTALGSGYYSFGRYLFMNSDRVIGLVTNISAPAYVIKLPSTLP